MERNVAGITLADLFEGEGFKQFRTFLDDAVNKAFEEKFEYGGVIYVNAGTGAVKYAGPKTSKPPRDDTVDLESMVKVPNEYTQILAAYHVHPYPTKVGACAPSGISDNKGDVSKARSSPWNEGFFLVATELADPVKPRDTLGKCTIVHQMETGKGQKYRIWYVENS